MQTGTQYIKRGGNDIDIATIAGTLSGNVFYPTDTPDAGFFVHTKRLTANALRLRNAAEVAVMKSATVVEIDLSDWK